MHVAESPPYTMHAVAYVRASTTHQHLSCDDQLRAIQDYCEREQLKLIRVFRDDGSSGTLSRSKRTGWGQLLDLVESGGMAGCAIVVWSLDRWSRDLREGLLTAWSMGDHQVGLHTTDSGPVQLDTVEGQLMGTLRLALAAQESRERGRRVRDRKQMHLEAGFWVSRAPYGYRLVGEIRGRKVLVPDPVEAPVVMSIYRRYDQRQSVASIVNGLIKAGIKSRHGRNFSIPAVKRILSGYSYGGMCKKVSGPVYPVACETFIPRDLWERVRERACRKGGRRGPTTKFALSGLVYCGACGRRMRLHVHSSTAGRRRCYRCPGLETWSCENKLISHLEPFEEDVLRWLLWVAGRKDLRQVVRRYVMAENAEALAAGDRCRRLEADLKQLENQERRLVDAIRMVGLSPVIGEELRAVRDKHGDVLEMARAARVASATADIDQSTDEIMDRLGEGGDLWQLRDFIDEIVVGLDQVATIRGLGLEGRFNVRRRPWNCSSRSKDQAGKNTS